MAEGTLAPVTTTTRLQSVAADEPAKKRRGVSLYLSRNPAAIIGLALMVGFVLLAIFAPWIAPAGFDDQNLRARALPPAWATDGSWAHPLGTDQLGRDILSRIVYGTRVSLGLAAGSIVIAGVVGVTVGLLAGYFGGAIDSIMMRLTDIQLSLPYLLFAIGILAIMGPSIPNLALVMVINSWAAYARLIRVSTLSVREREYVTAASSLGAGDLRIIMKHVLPNVLAPAVIITSFRFAELIILEASLSFLGLGVQPPLPSWGGMLGEGREYFTTAWWLTTFPGIAIMLAALSANMLGDSIRDFLDPQLRKL
jgi:peptide/nickel transport system permease protein